MVHNKGLSVAPSLDLLAKTDRREPLTTRKTKLEATVRPIGDYSDGRSRCPSTVGYAGSRDGWISSENYCCPRSRYLTANTAKNRRSIAVRLSLADAATFLASPLSLPKRAITKLCL